MPISSSSPLTQSIADSSVITAVRVANPSKLDGKPTDEVRNQATPITHFMQREPHEGQPATEQTKVRRLVRRSYDLWNGGRNPANAG